MSKYILVLVIVFALTGCSKPVPVVQYKEVYVPTPMKLDRPDRPRLKSNETFPEYLSRVLNYSRVLEGIIDINNTTIEN